MTDDSKTLPGRRQIKTSYRKKIERVFDPHDPTLFYDRITDADEEIKREGEWHSIRSSRETPWLGYLNSVNHDEGPIVSATRANVAFKYVDTTMLAIPGKVFTPGQALTFTPEDLMNMQTVDQYGKLLARSDTMEIVGFQGPQFLQIPVEAMCSYFWELCEKNRFRVNGVGALLNNQYLFMFARHTEDVFEISRHRFVRYCYFGATFGSGLAPCLCHVAYDTHCGELLPIDIEDFAPSKRTRGFQVASRRKTLGADGTLSQLTMDRWDDDWAKYCKYIRAMSEADVVPLQLLRIAMPTLKDIKRPKRDIIAANLPRYLKESKWLSNFLERTQRAFESSYITTTEATANTLLGAYLLVSCSVFKSDQLSQGTWVTSLRTTGPLVKREAFDICRKILIERRKTGQ